ncbi:hypothetical protein [Streptomyces sp. NPDC002403]
MTPAQFRNQHGNPTTWTDSDIDSYQVIAETSHETRLAFRMRRLTYPAYQALQAIHHLSTNTVATMAGLALIAYASLTRSTAVNAALVGIGLYLAFAWGIDGNEKACPICRRNRRLDAA